MNVPHIPENMPWIGLEAALAYKVFGPSASLVGHQLADLMRFAEDNVRRAAEATVTKLGARVEQPGALSPRSLLKAFNEAAISDDEVVAEYIGGVLASGRDAEGRDDRAVNWTALIGRLSSDQLRLHYTLYETLRSVASGVVSHQDLNLGLNSEREELATHVSAVGLFVALGWLDPEQQFLRFTEAFDGLHREGLVDHEYMFGSADDIRAQFPNLGHLSDVNDVGLVWTPSLRGVMLYLWGHGQGRRHFNDFLDAALETPVHGEYQLAQPAMLIRQPGVVDK